MVGVTGLEPATSRPPAVRASQLRHTPKYKAPLFYQTLEEKCAIIVLVYEKTKTGP